MNCSTHRRSALGPLAGGSALGPNRSRRSAACGRVQAAGGIRAQQEDDLRHGDMVVGSCRGPLRGHCAAPPRRGSSPPPSRVRAVAGQGTFDPLGPGPSGRNGALVRCQPWRPTSPPLPDQGQDRLGRRGDRGADSRRERGAMVEAEGLDADHGDPRLGGGPGRGPARSRRPGRSRGSRPGPDPGARRDCEVPALGAHVEDGDRSRCGPRSQGVDDDHRVPGGRPPGGIEQVDQRRRVLVLDDVHPAIPRSATAFATAAATAGPTASSPRSGDPRPTTSTRAEGRMPG